jgi:hypothetical protein
MRRQPSEPEQGNRRRREDLVREHMPDAMEPVRKPFAVWFMQPSVPIFQYRG